MRHHLTATMLGVLGAMSSSACVAGDDPTDHSSSAMESPPPHAPQGIDPEIFIGHHTNWTIDRGAEHTYRIVAYGDSIFAGYRESLVDLARRAAPYVAGEYFASAWGANIQVVRRTRSGAIAREVYEKSVLGEKSYMADPSTRVVYFEMCGNDYLQARDAFEGQTGTCSNARLDDALAACKTYTAKAMETINATATTAKQKAITNLYYPGFAKDNVNARCTGPGGERVNILDRLLPYMARSNWHACTLAKQYGFGCVDSFAEFMGADYDSNGDGLVDSDALRFDPNESEEAYVHRITVTLRGTLRDSNQHATSGSSSADYLLNDDTHPTHYLGSIRSGATGKSPPDFSDSQLASGKNPRWNEFGHERMGWALWNAGPSRL